MGFETPFSDGHKTGFLLLAVPVSLFGILANAWYLFWQIRDHSLICSFSVILGNISLCNMLLSLALSPLNVASLYYQDVATCASFRILTSFFEVEEAILFLLITADRLYFLYKGAGHYRNAVTVRRMCIMTFASWAIVAALSAMIWVINLDVITHTNEKECKVVKPLSITALPVALDVLMLCLSVLLAKSCQASQLGGSSGTYISNVSSQPRGGGVSHSHQQLHGRDCAAYGLQASGEVDFTQVERLRPSQADILDPLPSSATGSQEPGTDSGIGAAHQETPVSGKDKTDKRGQNKVGGQDVPQENTSKKSGAQQTRPSGPDLQKDVPQSADGIKGEYVQQRRSIVLTENTSKANIPFGGRACGDCTHQSNAALLHPRVKSTLPNILARTMSTKHVVRTETMAAQQLGLLLLVHFLLSTPVYICRLLASTRSDWQTTVNNFVHWLDWLFVLQACLYPAIYCLYSNRLREHLKCLRFHPSCFRSNRVRASIQRLGSKKQ